ncbi:hypothetical protein ElyMa_004770300 [Elysia marginata]|uniref:Uncharacterized protein n=1 Tax=Elysia marginata TaxID=1093978 RepID=A0AAV4IF87_9GAST|nr:hypothetical protein ElyMa_004770300 [Elysia marginata]
MEEARGKEVEDWQTNSNLLLLNDAEDIPTYSRSWLTTSTLDPAFATKDIALKTSRKVEDQLRGHKQPGLKKRNSQLCKMELQNGKLGPFSTMNQQNVPSYKCTQSR